MPRRLKTKNSAARAKEAKSNSQIAAQRSESIAEQVKILESKETPVVPNDSDEMEAAEHSSIIADKPEQLPDKAADVASTSDVTAENNDGVAAASSEIPAKKKPEKPKETLVERAIRQQELGKRLQEGLRKERERVANMNEEERAEHLNKKREKTKANRAKNQAGLIFPVGRCKNQMLQYLGVPKNKRVPLKDKDGNKKMRLVYRKPHIKVTKEAAIFTAAILEYMTAEVLEISGNVAIDKKRKTIKPRHVMLAIRDDDEINKLIPKSTVFAQTGCVPKEIPTVLLKPYQKSNAWTSTTAANCYQPTEQLNRSNSIY